MKQVLAWRRVRDPGPGAGHAAANAVRAACLVAGAIAGAATAAGAFFYDGGGRVNVLLVLALFVALPLATIALFAVAAATRHGLRGFSAGHLGAAAARVLPWAGARDLARLASGGAGPGVAKWLLLGWSQWLGLGFGAGAVAAALALVLFTDLAFGWSTTLDLAPARVRELCAALALPWRDLLPGAVPDAALVEASRYFRLGAGSAAPPDPALLGRWWPFVLAAMTCYGVLPRLLTLALVRWRTAAACAAALVADERVHGLLDRMNTPLVDTRSPDPEAPRAPHTRARVSAALPPAASWHVVNWAAVPLDERALRELLGGADLATVHPAGGGRRTSEDRALALTLATDHGSGGVLVVARAWEPPTLDLMDFLAELRAALPSRRPVALLPVALSGGAPAAPPRAHADIWLETLARAAPDGVTAVRLHPETP